MLQEDFGVFNYHFPMQANLRVLDKHQRLLQIATVPDCGVASLDQLQQQMAASEFNVRNYEQLHCLVPQDRSLPFLVLSFSVNQPQEADSLLQARIQDTLKQVQLVQQSYKYRADKFKAIVLVCFNIFKKDQERVVQGWAPFIDGLLRRQDLVQAVLTTCHYQFDISFFGQLVAKTEEQGEQIEGLQRKVEQQQAQLDVYAQIIQDYQNIIGRFPS